MNTQDFNAGLRAAASQLVRTAEDLEARLHVREVTNAQAKGAGRLGWQAEAEAIRTDRAKTMLLYGQAKHILELSK